MRGAGSAARRWLRRSAKLLRLLPEPAFRRGLRFGVGAALEHRPALEPLRFAAVVDIGANVGQFSLLARALNPAARILAFEPLPAAAARYRRVFARDAGVTLFQAAVAPRRGSATMHVSAAPDSSSLLPITRRQVERFPGTREIGQTAVETGPLGHYLARADLPPPALLKIDVQGFELEVLRASAPLLDAFARVYVEASFEELYAGQALVAEVAGFLDEHGFEEVGRFNLALAPDGSPVQADFLFYRPSGPGGSASRASSPARSSSTAAAAVATGSARQAIRTRSAARRRPSGSSESQA